MQKFSIILIFVLISVAAKAQNFEWEVKLEKVPADGFFDILLRPEITAKLNENFGDIRLYDKSNNEIPYILHREAKENWSTYYIEYPIIKKTHRKRFEHTELIFENPEQQAINNIVLRIRNSDVSKWLTLNGSNDRREWFVIKDRYRYNSFYSTSETSVIKILDFPPSNYKYYQIIVSDYFNKPVDIISVGYYDTKTVDGKYLKTVSPYILQDDTSENHTTIIHAKFPEKQYVDKLVFNIEGPSYFLRKAEVMTEKTIKKKRKTVNYQQTVAAVELSSFSDNTVYFDKQPLREFTVHIYNNDNAPLNIKSIETYQLNTYLTAELSAGKQYILRFGNKDTRAPVYDLRYFVDSIPKNRINVLTKSLTKIQHKDSEKEEGSVPKLLVWVVLSVVICFLAFMTYRMVREIPSKNNR